MSKLILNYSASEAFEMMKEMFPKDYQDKINVGKALIVRLKKMYKKESYKEAYQKYINYGCRAESGIMMLAALQQLIDEEKAEQEAFQNTVYGIIEQQEQILKQQEALESNINMMEIDKRALRQFYRKKLDELNNQLYEISKTIEVVEPVMVSEPNLFSSYVSL